MEKPLIEGRHKARRRTRSVGSVPSSWLSDQQSDDMASSSHSKDKPSSYYVSESDDGASEVVTSTDLKFGVSNSPHNVESDSFNENKAQTTTTKRKRKSKKMTSEDDIGHSGEHSSRHFFRNSSHAENSILFRTGKCKREKLCMIPMGRKGQSPEVYRDSKVLAISKLSLNDDPTDDVKMEVSASSSSSITSTGSEAGIFTNDEGREGDDEQSDWVGGTERSMIGVSYNKYVPNSNRVETFQRMLTDGYKHIPNNRRSLRLHGDRIRRDNGFRANTRRVDITRKNITSENIEASFTLQHPEVTSDLREMEIDTEPSGRRHTFSGFKKRKRIPDSHVETVMETVSDHSEVVKQRQLSDICSSDSVESLV